MRDFTFCIPTKIVFGKNKTENTGEYLKQIGKRVLLVYGSGSIKKNGCFDKVINSLRNAGIEWVEFSGVQSNPVLSKVYDGIKIFREENLDAILAVGGGSVIDTAKTIAAGVYYDGDIWDCFVGNGKIKKTVPIAVVLTMAATASESNSFAVITNKKTRAKLSISSPKLYPIFSILDPVNTYSAPIDYSMYGAVDAISHLLEGYFNTIGFDFPIQQTIAEGLVRNIIGSAKVVFADPTNYRARAELMWAASLAYSGVVSAGTGGNSFPMHMIEHAISAIFDIPHGAGLSVVIPAWLKFHLSTMYEKIAQFSRYVFKVKIADDYKAAEAGIAKLESWFKSVGCPIRLNDVGLSVSDIPAISTNALIIAKQWGIKNYSQEVIERIIMIAASR